jgi:hypothetical protein
VAQFLPRDYNLLGLFHLDIALLWTLPRTVCFCGSEILKDTLC